MSRIFAVVLLLLLAVACSNAQVLEVSNASSVPLPEAGHNYLGTLSETVDPANGSTSVRLPVPVPGGRQLSIPFYFSYDTNAEWMGLFSADDGNDTVPLPEAPLDRILLRVREFYIQKCSFQAVRPWHA